MMVCRTARNSTGWLVFALLRLKSFGCIARMCCTLAAVARIRPLAPASLRRDRTAASNTHHRLRTQLPQRPTEPHTGSSSSSAPAAATTTTNQARARMGKKGRKELNPADAYRKELRKKEIKKNKKERKRVRELGSYIKDPDLMKTEVRVLRACVLLLTVCACLCAVCVGDNTPPTHSHKSHPHRSRRWSGCRPTGRWTTSWWGSCSSSSSSTLPSSSCTSASRSVTICVSWDASSHAALTQSFPHDAAHQTNHFTRPPGDGEPRRHGR